MFLMLVTLLHHNLSSIEQVTVTKLLGIYISATLSTAAHVEHILTVANQRMYLLAQLKNQGLSHVALHNIFTAIILSVVTILFHPILDSCL